MLAAQQFSFQWTLNPPYLWNNTIPNSDIEGEDGKGGSRNRHQIHYIFCCLSLLARSFHVNQTTPSAFKCLSKPEIPLQNVKETQSIHA